MLIELLVATHAASVKDLSVEELVVCTIHRLCMCMHVHIITVEYAQPSFTALKVMMLLIVKSRLECKLK